MKLLFVIGNIAGQGGTERVTCELANAFVEAGKEVEILSPFGPDYAYFELAPAVHIRGLSLPEAQGKLGRFIRVSRAIHRYCSRSRPDVVVLVDTILFLFCLPWAWRSPSRFICWEHFNLGTEHGSRFRTIARKAAARWCDAIVVLTDRDAAVWRQRFAVNERVKAIWNSVPRFDEKPSAFAERRPTVLAVGRLTEQKGFDLLLRAWQQLDQKRDGWLLRIVGSGQDEATLKYLAQDLGIADSVIFVGHTKAIAEEYRVASIYVMSSRWEGLPMTLLEAQYFGLPSVAADCETGPREVLANGSGVLVPAEDPSALASALNQLMSDPELRKKLGSEALENARLYEPDRIRQSWECLLGELTSKRQVSLTNYVE